MKTSIRRRLGVVYSINQDGSGFQQLEAFAGPNGNVPTGHLVAVGSNLYGATESDGPTLPEPSALVLAVLGCAALVGCGVRNRRRSTAGAG